jgi:hypothetical protein
VREESARAAAAPAAAAVAFDPAEEVAERLFGVPCARLAARFDPADGIVQVVGHTASEGERRTLAASLEEVPGVERVDISSLSALGPPFCPVIDLLSRLDTMRFGEDVFSPARSDAAAAPARQGFSGGDYLELTLTTPDYPSHVQVNYFDRSGTVVHLFPGLEPYRALPADIGLRIGGENGRGLNGRNVRVVAPFGTNLVLAVTSSAPVFTEPRPPAEDAAAYLDALAARLERLATDGATIDMMTFVVETVAPEMAAGRLPQRP